MAKFITGSINGNLSNFKNMKTILIEFQKWLNKIKEEDAEFLVDNDYEDIAIMFMSEHNANMIPVPQRIQMKRTKGFNLQQYSKSLNGLECIIVSRPTKWGNQFKVGETFVQPDGKEIILDNQQVVSLYEQSINLYGQPVSNKEIIDELKGKNLACWCMINGKPCHADILLELANCN